MTLSTPGAGTLALQARLPDLLQEKLFTPYGVDVLIVWPSSSETTWGETAPPSQGVEVRAALVPMSAGSNARVVASGSGTPIPAYEFFVLCRDADLSQPGWHVELNGVSYYPTEDASDQGMQGVCWYAPMRAPGQVTASAAP